MKWFIKCIRNYVNFSGRARRSEYWYFVLFSILLMLVAFILDWICFGRSSLFYGLAGLFLFLPNLAVMSRRLHDTAAVPRFSSGIMCSASSGRSRWLFRGHRSS